MKTTTNQAAAYDLGVAGEKYLILEWSDREGDARLGDGRPLEGLREFYGIRITRAQNLTVITSDGSCTHFSEYELPIFQADEFAMRLPNQARLISVSVDGIEVGLPTVEDGLCRLRLPPREPQQTAHRLSFRMANPPVRLGFVGQVELVLPEVFQTVGTTEWVIALPTSFETQVMASGLEHQHAAPDLSRFGDYGRILKSHPQIYLAKDLTPPGPLSLQLKYRQRFAEMNGLRGE
jgi:hypothetical protein